MVRVNGRTRKPKAPNHPNQVPQAVLPKFPTAGQRIAVGQLLVTTAEPRVTHLAKASDNRRAVVLTACGKSAWWWDNLAWRSITTLPTCSACKARRG